jgi:hypothetical protein
VGPMWKDIEDYPDWKLGPTIPDVSEVEALSDECVKLGVRDGYYSNPTEWGHAGNPQIGPDAVEWDANYTNVKPADLSAARPFGGLTVVGHQFSSTPLDQSMFLI